MSPVDLITFAIALIGAGLGILNYIHQRDQTKVRVKVRPSQVFGVGAISAFEGIAIDVTNLSSFPITVSEVGFTLKGSKEKMLVHSPIFYDNSKLPIRLEPRSSITAYVETPQNPKFALVDAAYARTQCGERITGTSGALKSIVKAAKG